MKRRQRGQSLAEYAIICGILVLALTTPVTTDNRNVVQWLKDSMKSEHSGFLYAIGLPPLPGT